MMFSTLLTKLRNIIFNKRPHLGYLPKCGPRYFEQPNGLYSRLITEGFELASNKALEDLEAVKVKREIDPDTLIQMARTSLRTKVYQKLALTENVADAVLPIKSDKEPIDLHMVEIMEMQHKTDMDTVEVNSRFFYKKAEEPEKLVQAERQFIDDRVKKIIPLKKQVCDGSNKGFIVINQKIGSGQSSYLQNSMTSQTASNVSALVSLQQNALHDNLGPSLTELTGNNLTGSGLTGNSLMGTSLGNSLSTSLPVNSLTGSALHSSSLSGNDLTGNSLTSLSGTSLAGNSLTGTSVTGSGLSFMTGSSLSAGSQSVAGPSNAIPASSVSQNAMLQQRQKPQRSKLPPPSKIPASAVEMPGYMMTTLDVQFGNLEFGSDSSAFSFRGNESFNSAFTSADSNSTSTVNDHGGATVGQVQNLSKTSESLISGGLEQSSPRSSSLCQQSPYTTRTKQNQRLSKQVEVLVEERAATESKTEHLLGEINDKQTEAELIVENLHQQQLEELQDDIKDIDKTVATFIRIGSGQSSSLQNSMTSQTASNVSALVSLQQNALHDNLGPSLTELTGNNLTGSGLTGNSLMGTSLGNSLSTSLPVNSLTGSALHSSSLSGNDLTGNSLTSLSGTSLAGNSLTGTSVTGSGLSFMTGSSLSAGSQSVAGPSNAIPASSVSQNAMLQQRQKPQRSKLPPPSKIPASAVEIPGYMMTTLDVQFGNLEFGSDSSAFSFRGNESFNSAFTSADSNSTSTVNDHGGATVGQVQNLSKTSESLISGGLEQSSPRSSSLCQQSPYTTRTKQNQRLSKQVEVLVEERAATESKTEHLLGEINDKQREAKQTVENLHQPQLEELQKGDQSPSEAEIELPAGWVWQDDWQKDLGRAVDEEGTPSMEWDKDFDFVYLQTPVTPRPYMFPYEVFCDSPGAAVSPDFIPYTCPPAGCFYYLATEEADSVFHPNCYSPGCESPRLPLRNMQCWLNSSTATPPHVDQVLPYPDGSQ